MVYIENTSSRRPPNNVIAEQPKSPVELAYTSWKGKVHRIIFKNSLAHVQMLFYTVSLICPIFTCIINILLGRTDYNLVQYTQHLHLLKPVKFSMCKVAQVGI